MNLDKLFDDLIRSMGCKYSWEADYSPEVTIILDDYDLFHGPLQSLDFLQEDLDEQI